MSLSSDSLASPLTPTAITVVTPRRLEAWGIASLDLPVVKNFSFWLRAVLLYIRKIFCEKFECSLTLSGIPPMNATTAVATDLWSSLLLEEKKLVYTLCIMRPILRVPEATCWMYLIEPIRLDSSSYLEVKWWKFTDDSICGISGRLKFN